MVAMREDLEAVRQRNVELEQQHIASMPQATSSPLKGGFPTFSHTVYAKTEAKDSQIDDDIGRDGNHARDALPDALGKLSDALDRLKAQGFHETQGQPSIGWKVHQNSYYQGSEERSLGAPIGFSTNGVENPGYSHRTSTTRQTEASERIHNQSHEHLHVVSTKENEDDVPREERKEENLHVLTQHEREAGQQHFSSKAAVCSEHDYGIDDPDFTYCEEVSEFDDEDDEDTIEDFLAASSEAVSQFYSDAIAAPGPEEEVHTESRIKHSHNLESVRGNTTVLRSLGDAPASSTIPFQDSGNVLQADGAHTGGSEPRTKARTLLDIANDSSADDEDD